MSSLRKSKTVRSSTSRRRINRNAFVFALVAVLVVLFLSLQLNGSRYVAGAEPSTRSSPDIVDAGGHCVLNEVSLQQRVASAAIIVEGQIVSNYSFWDGGRTNIYTSNLMKVFKVFQGEWSEDFLVIITEGGTVGNQKEVVSPSLQLASGEMGTFFLVPARVSDAADQGRNPTFEAYASMQGFIRYDLKSQTATEPFRTYRDIKTDVYGSITSLTGESYRTVAANRGLEGSYSRVDTVTPDAPPTISGFSPNPITAGTGSIVTINGTNFGATRGTGFVEFSTGDTGGASFVRALENDYASWTNNQIQVIVPGVGNASTGVIRVTNSDPASTTSTSQLTVTYSIINLNDAGFGKHGLHQDRNGAGGYTFQISNNAIGGMNTNTPAVASFLRAMNTWVCTSGINFIRGTDTAVNVAANDNVNVVTFDDANPLPAGVLAAMTSRFSGCGPGPGSFDFFVLELDMRVLRPTQLSWQYGPAAPSAGQFDFETVMLHELGHGHQFGHNNNGSPSTGSIMYWAVSPGTTKRSASPTFDLPAGQYTMSLSTTIPLCNLSTMSAIGCPSTLNKVADFDGDGRTDVSVFRPSNGFWYLLRSTAGFTGIPFGQNGDRPVPGDYDGDGKTDVSVFRNGTWYRLDSSNGTFRAIGFGTQGDLPAPGRYDTDNRTDLAVFRPSNGTWYVLKSTDGGLLTMQFGQNGDLPVSGDFDGDGRTDFTVFRPSNGTWYLQQTTAGFLGFPFGTTGDMPVPGNYDGDTRTDIAVFRPSNGTWYLQRSQLGFIGVNWGVNGDQPSAGDYDGDNKTDVAVFRETAGTFYISQSSNGALRTEQFGANGDTSIPRSYAP
jgi:hypothetical protein